VQLLEVELTKATVGEYSVVVVTVLGLENEKFIVEKRP
jgi:hypothetical protein